MSINKIMIAEDYIGILEAMQIILEDAGYDVETTESGQVARDIKENLTDLLLLDIWISDMDGTEICRHLKSQDRTKHIPTILCSANKDTRKLAQGCGADDFLAKPFEMNDLLDKVKNTSVKKTL